MPSKHPDNAEGVAPVTPSEAQNKTREELLDIAQAFGAELSDETGRVYFEPFELERFVAYLSTPQARAAQQAGSGGEEPDWKTRHRIGDLLDAYREEIACETYNGWARYRTPEDIRKDINAEVDRLTERAAPAEPAVVPTYEQRRAVMEAERNASKEAHERGVPLGDTGRRVYEIAFTNGWDRALALAQGGA